MWKTIQFFGKVISLNKDLLNYLKQMSAHAKELYYKDKNRDTLINYLTIKKLVYAVYVLSKEMERSADILNKANEAVSDWRYLFAYFGKYLGKERYSNIMYSAYTGLQTKKEMKKKQ